MKLSPSFPTKLIWTLILGMGFSIPNAGAAYRAKAHLANRSPAQALVGVSPKLSARHARELLGPKYTRVLPKGVESSPYAFETFIEETVRAQLPKEFKKQAHAVSRAVIEESERYEFDPVFLLAVIANESSFNPKIYGSVGEVGLMQIKPDTAEWIRRKFNIPNVKTTAKALENPVTNVRIGAAFLALLREQFDSHGRLYLAAYNMGAGNVHKKLSANDWPKQYPVRVMKRYLAFYQGFKLTVRDAQKRLYAVSELIKKS